MSLPSTNCYASTGESTPASTDEELNKSKDYCTGIWSEALTQCRDELGEVDFQRLDQYENADSMISSLQQMGQSYGRHPLPVLFKRLEPCLGSLRNFTIILALGACTPGVKTAVIWGILNLSIELSAKSARIFSSIVDMLESMAHDLDMFRLYEYVFKQDHKLENTLVDVFVDVITFWMHTVRFLRKNPLENTMRLLWPNVEKEYNQVTDRIRTRINRLKEKSEAIHSLSLRHMVSTPNQAEILRELEKLNTGFDQTKGMIGGQEMSGLQANNIPYPRYPSFYARQRELEMMRTTLDHDPRDTRFRSLALWGMGGIGKTQLALEYAREREEKGVPAILWVNGETALDIYASFTEIAELLELEGRVNDASGNQNQFVVTKWLQKCRSNWLLIFDNVEDSALIRSCWPVSPLGSILVTSRNEAVSMDPAFAGLEVSLFTPFESANYIYSILQRNSYSDSEKDSCAKLAGRLDGLPLALTLMGMQIRRTHTKIETFFKDYEEDFEEYHRAPAFGFYRHSLVTAYQTSFKYLSEQSVAILGVLCFIAPDSIPEDIFRPKNSAWLVPGLAFCEKSRSFENALAPLFNSSLIGRDTENSTFRVHRIIQEEYRIWIGPEKGLSCLFAAIKLLCAAFPKSINGLPLRNEWQTCKKYIQHVLAACRRYKEQKDQPGSTSELANFTTLLTSCGWYLMECGAWSQFRILIDVAFDVCKDKESIDYAHLLVSAASVECERGNAKDSYPLIAKALEIRTRLLPSDHEELANLYNNYANIHLTHEVTPDTIKEAESCLKKAMEIDFTKPESERNNILHIRYLNLGLVYTLQGEYEKAWKSVEEGQHYAILQFGKKGHFEAVGDYFKGNILYHQEKWQAAEKYYKAAREVFSAANDNHPSTSSAELKLACVAMKENRLKDATEFLHKALLKCQLNEPEKADKGDTARMMRKLSQVLELQGQKEEAAEIATTAQNIRRNIQGQRFYSLPDNDYSYDLMVFAPFR